MYLLSTSVILICLMIPQVSYGETPRQRVGEGPKATQLAPTSAELPHLRDRAPLRFDQPLREREVWALELGKWPHFCTSRAQQKSLLTSCESVLNTLNAFRAIYRVRRLNGFFDLTEPELTSAQLDPLITPPRATKLSSLERAALLDLTREALLTTGDLRWLLSHLRVAQLSPLLEGARCTLGESCAEELISLLYSVELMSVSNGPSLSSRLTQLDARGGALLSALLSRSQVLKRLARTLSGVHPNGGLNADRPRGGSRSWWARRARLATLSLDDKALSAWVKSERLLEETPQVIQELNENQVGINVDRALGLGALLTRGRLKTSPTETVLPSEALSALRSIYHLHAHAVMSVYLKRYREPPYGTRVPALGVIALTADRAEGSLGIQLSSLRWLNANTTRVQASPLSASGIRAEGMFSRIALRDQGARRGLYFVRPNGAQLLETEVDLTRPDLLRVRYTQDMLATYLFSEARPRHALLVGLGGGSMVHALRAYDPQLSLDVVEIDPVVVKLAREYFGVNELERPQESGEVKIFTEDGFDFLKRSHPHRYEMIWMDAFLQPTSETDSAGSPLNLKTRDFLQSIAERHLTPRGVIAINLNHHAGLRRDVETIRAAFPVSSIWQVPNTGNYIALGVRSPLTESADQLRERAAQLSKSQASPFRYEVLVERALSGLTHPISQ